MENKCDKNHSDIIDTAMLQIKTSRGTDITDEDAQRFKEFIRSNDRAFITLSDGTISWKNVTQQPLVNTREI